MKEQGVLGGQKALGYVRPEPSIRMERVGSPEPQSEVGPGQTAWPRTAPGGRWQCTGAGTAGLAFKSLSGCGEGKIRPQVGQRGAHALQTKAA